MARRLIAGTALALVIGPLSLGCSGSGKSKDQQELAWATKVCDAAWLGVDKFQLPSYPSKDVRSARESYLTFLDGLTKHLELVRTRVQATGAPPVAGGPAVVTKALANLETVRNTLTEATNGLRSVKPADRKAFQTAVAKLKPAMAQYAGYQGPVRDLRSNPKLGAALNKSPSCKAHKL